MRHNARILYPGEKEEAAQEEEEERNRQNEEETGSERSEIDMELGFFILAHSPSFKNSSPLLFNFFTNGFRILNFHFLQAECPICFKMFPPSKVAEHSADCGSPSFPLFFLLLLTHCSRN